MAFFNPPAGATIPNSGAAPQGPKLGPRFNMNSGGGWSSTPVSGGGYQGGAGAFPTRMSPGVTIPPIQINQIPRQNQPRQQQPAYTPGQFYQMPSFGTTSQTPPPVPAQPQSPTAPPSAYNNPGALRPTYPGYQPISPGTYNQQFSGGASGTSSASSSGYGSQASQGGAQTSQGQPNQGSQPGQTTAQITSAYGTPVLPFADPNLNNQTVNRQFESALGTEGLQSILNGMRPSNNGMTATAGDQQMLTPFMAQQGTAGADALAGVPYAQGLGNANSLLGWQSGQSGDVLGQFNNLLGMNNAQQQYGLSNLLNQLNFGTGTLGNQVGLGGNVLGSLAGPGSILSNLLGGLTGSLGNLTGGLIGLA